MSALFDRFLKDPSSVSCGGDNGACCGSTAPKDTECGNGADAAAPAKSLTPCDYKWITGTRETPAGPVPIVSTRFGVSERWDSWRLRWGIGRMKSNIPPGLYGVGSPDAWSPVFVTCNYKMTFDLVRRTLAGRDGWILVLDTRGINVWCAAGKGTFGTDELVNRIALARLAGVVSHRTLVLPQLGASGVAAHEVAKQTKFRVIYGPIRVEDLPAFLDAGMKAEPTMRRVRFVFRDRIILVPEEIAAVAVNPAFWVIVGLWIAGLLGLKIFSFSLPAVIGALLIGAVAVPALLPWIPVRRFSFKGWLLGLIGTLTFLAVRGTPSSTAGWVSAASYILCLPALSAFIGMGFTGSSPITSLSGVVKEMKTAVPLIVLSLFLGVAAMITSAVV
jgi:hypothetical protein